MFAALASLRLSAGNWVRLVLALHAVVFSGGCATHSAVVGAPGEIPVYVVTHGWHTGLAMRASDIDFARWRPLPHAARATYLEIGWGDRDYYPAPGFNLWYAVKALAWPTPSVLHVAGFDEPPARYFPQSEVVELRLAPAAFERLIAYIVASFEQDPAPIAPSLYASGGFYPSRESFHLFKTCNVWVGRALREAEVDVRPTLTTEGLLAQLRPKSSGPRGERRAPPKAATVSG